MHIHYCDMCGREIKSNDKIHFVKIVHNEEHSGRNVERPSSREKEICPFCKELVLDFLDKHKQYVKEEVVEGEVS